VLTRSQRCPPMLQRSGEGPVKPCGAGTTENDTIVIDVLDRPNGLGPTTARPGRLSPSGPYTETTTGRTFEPHKPCDMVGNRGAVRYYRWLTRPKEEANASRQLACDRLKLLRDGCRSTWNCESPCHKIRSEPSAAVRYAEAISEDHEALSLGAGRISVSRCAAVASPPSACFPICARRLGC
jgi:hypothetical protein